MSPAEGEAVAAVLVSAQRAVTREAEGRAAVAELRRVADEIEAGTWLEVDVERVSDVLEKPTRAGGPFRGYDSIGYTMTIRVRRRRPAKDPK